MNEKHISETEWWNDLCDGIFGTRKGGARIIVDAEDAKTGVGKTGLAVYLARLLALTFDYEIEPEDLTLSGNHYLGRWREHPGPEQPSVLILDELGGAGAGHARRAMSNQNVELGNAWQLMRKKRIVSIVTLPHWSKVDKDMRMQADYRLWCRHDPIGYFQPYEVGSEFSSGGVNTRGYDDVDRIRFPNLDDSGDDVYAYLDARKDELLDSQYFDADELQPDEDEDEATEPEDVRREEQVKQALRLVKPWNEDLGLSYSDASQYLDYGHSWIGNRVSEWKAGEHRGLLDDIEEVTA